jgi:hypothetical protein
MAMPALNAEIMRRERPGASQVLSIDDDEGVRSPSPLNG